MAKSKSDKMYGNSPKIETNADGKKVVTRGMKDAPGGDAGVEGVPTHVSAAMDMAHKHEKERLALHQKHEMEHHSMRSKHADEGSPAEEASETAAEEKAETPAKEKKEKSKGVE